MSERPEEEDPNDLYKVVGDDSDPGNLLVRAGYLHGLATRAQGEDQRFLLRASRSLRAFYEHLMKEHE